MTDTVTRILDYAEGYARAHTYGSSNERHAARQALQDELTRVFTTTHPAPEGFYQGSIADMILKGKRNE